MKQLYPLAILLIVLPFLCSAQVNFKPGYAVNLRGDTLRGAIDFQEWNSNPAFVHLRTSTGEVKKITPSAYKAFEVNGFDAYESYNGPLSMDPTDASHQGERDTSFKVDTVFLKVLKKGKNVNLYSYKDVVRERFFIKEADKDNQATELTYHIYFKNARTVAESVFIQQLFALAQKYNITDEATARMIQQAEYKYEDLLKITNIINRDLTKPGKAKRGLTYNLFAGVGVNVATFKTNSVQTHLQPTNTSFLPLVSFGLDVPVNPNTGRLVFRIEAVITANKFKSSYDNVNYPYYPLHYSFTQLTYNLSPQIIYNIYNKENFKFYLGAGGEIFVSQYKNQNYYSFYAGENHPVTPLFIYNNFSLTATVKAGVKINNRFDVYMSYQVPESITYSTNAGLKLTTIFAGLNYHFTR